MANRFKVLVGYFNEVAGSYASAIEPVFDALAEGLVAFARLRPAERVLDLGTGTGLCARHAARTCRMVVAVDFSHQMCMAARRQGTPNVIQANMHSLALCADVFDVALASLAFNSTDPAVSLYEAWRMLKPGGRLALLEWGTTDPLSDLLDDTLAAYAVEDPPPSLAARRAAQQTPYPWDDLETSDDIVTALETAGFRRIDVDIVTQTVVLPDVAAFIRYKLAWPTRRAELAAMPDDVRLLCLEDLRENLGAHSEQQGRLRWEPNLVRVLAYKPTE